MSELERATLLDLWRRMVRIRRFEERVHIETMEKRTEGYTHTAYGEEATAVGVIALLRDDDWFTTTYRNHHHAIARDMPLEAIAGELLGKQTGVSQRSVGTSPTGPGTSAASCWTHRADAAFAAKRLGWTASPSFFGDGACTREPGKRGFAALLQVPSSSFGRATSRETTETLPHECHLGAGGARHPAVQVDGMDVRGAQVTERAMDRHARAAGLAHQATPTATAVRGRHAPASRPSRSRMAGETRSTSSVVPCQRIDAMTLMMDEEPSASGHR
jgi:pyruvate dehydrogenase E1 component alpha subunit